MQIDNKIILKYSENISVLYAEDDELLRSSMGKIFSKYFKNIDITLDGKEALNKYLSYEKENNKHYDLLITDINMPNMNGLELSEEVLRINEAQSIIFLTAFNENEYLSKAIELGVDGFLTKPLNSKQFQRVLYKVTKAIHETNDLDTYYKEVDSLNIKLEEQNAELTKSLRILDTMVYKEGISKQKDKKIKKKDTQQEQIEKYDLEQLVELKTEDLYELEELQIEIDIAVISVLETNDTDVSVPIIIARLSRFSSIISPYGFIKDVGYAISELVHIMKNNNLPENEEQVNSIFIFLESFTFVLKKWNENIMSSDLEGIKFLEPSILSDLSMISSMWLNQFDDEADDSEIEFF